MKAKPIFLNCLLIFLMLHSSNHSIYNSTLYTNNQKTVSSLIVTDPVITSISVSCKGSQYPGSNPTGLPLYFLGPGSSMMFRADIQGYNVNSLNSIWSIRSGDGQLSTNEGITTIFTAPAALGEITIIRAAAVDDPSVYADFAVRVASMSIYITRTAATVIAGDHVPFLASLSVDGISMTGMNDIVWIVLSGGGSIGYDQRPEYGHFKNNPSSTNYVTFYAPDSPGNATLQVAPLEDPNQFANIPVTIVANGPHTCANIVIPSGSMGFSVWWSAEPNQPYITNGTIGNYDPVIGQTASLTVHAQVLNPATAPIESVVVREVADNGLSIPYYLSLQSGSLTNGTWYGEWTENDTHCNNYSLEVIVTNAAGQFTDTIGLQ